MYSLLAQIDFSNEDQFTPAKIGDISEIINFLMPVITVGASIAFLVLLLVGAFTWITAGDSAENVSKAQKTIMFAIIGLLMVLLSFAAVKLIAYVFGVGDTVQF